MRFVLLGSGRGSNARAILEAWRDGNLGQAEPVAIFSDKADAPILQLGKEFGVASEWIDPGPKKTFLVPEAEERFIQAIRATDPRLIVLAGFMRVLKDPFLRAFDGMIVNLHPSLLPSFKGLDGISQAFDYGVRITGCTVHYVNGELDGGPIIDQEAVRIEKMDTRETLAAKVHAAEHDLLPRVIARLSEEFK